MLFQLIYGPVILTLSNLTVTLVYSLIANLMTAVNGMLDRHKEDSVPAAADVMCSWQDNHFIGLGNTTTPLWLNSKGQGPKGRGTDEKRDWAIVLS